MKTYFVSKNGFDDNKGTADKPFATLKAAVEESRKCGAGSVKRIVIKEGEYFLNETIELDIRDNGLVIEKEEGAKVTLYGGRKIEGWQKDSEKFFAAPVENVEDRTWDFRSMLVNGRFCERARLPETGRYEHLSRFNVGWATTLERPAHAGFWREPTKEEVTTLIFNEGDINRDIEIKNAELTIFNSWETSLVGVESIDWETNTVKFSNRSGMPPGAFGTHQFVIWNTCEGMTRPGQWYLDRVNSRVVYWPLPDEDLNSAVVIAPVIESIVRIVGTLEKPVKNITIKGLCLSVTTTRLEGVKETYGEIVNYDGGDRTGRVDGALFASYITDCNFIDIEVDNAAGQGIKMYEVKDSKIKGCHIHHIGGRAVTLLGNGTVFDNCYVHDIGLIYPAVEAVAVRGMFGKGITVSNCEIHDVSYTAIHVITAHNHVIVNNLIYNAMQEMRDGSGIYLSFCHYITVRGNFVRDVETDPISKATRKKGEYMNTEAHAYYLDEESENCLLEYNLSLNCHSPYKGHQARNNKIRNNFFINEKDDLLWHMPLSWSENINRNVFYSGKGAILVGNPAAITNFGNNLLFSGSGKIAAYELFIYKSTGVAELDMSKGSIVTDPLITGCQDGTIKLALGSPIHGLGIKPLDVSKAGLKIKLAKQEV